jgi:hypothetical protein
MAAVAELPAKGRVQLRAARANAKLINELNRLIARAERDAKRAAADAERFKRAKGTWLAAAPLPALFASVGNDSSILGALRGTGATAFAGRERPNDRP